MEGRGERVGGSAYTYQAFSDAELTTYAEALEDQKMQQVHELANVAV